MINNFERKYENAHKLKILKILIRQSDFTVPNQTEGENISRAKYMERKAKQQAFDMFPDLSDKRP